MNIYDKVHEMVKCLKETEEYTTFCKLKEEISKETEISDKLKEFRVKQRKAQMSYMTNGKQDENEIKELENEYSILIGNENVRKLFEAEMKFDILLADIQKIMGEGIKEIIE